MSLTASIKVSGTTIDVKGIAVIRKATGLPISEIRARVASGCPIVECPPSDSNGIAEIVKLGQELKSVGINTQAHLGTHKMAMEYFVNRLRTEKDDITHQGREDMYEDEPWWNLDLSQCEDEA